MNRACIPVGSGCADPAACTYLPPPLLRLATPSPPCAAVDHIVPPGPRCGALRHDADFFGFQPFVRQLGAMTLLRKRRRRAPRRWSEGLDDLHDYYHPTPGRQVVARAPGEEGPIAVTDDWPELVPIGDAELRVIEGHLREELDALFGPLP